MRLTNSFLLSLYAMVQCVAFVLNIASGPGPKWVVPAVPIELPYQSYGDDHGQVAKGPAGQVGGEPHGINPAPAATPTYPDIPRPESE